MPTRAEMIEAMRLGQLRRFAPEAFAPGSLLYVGAMPERPPECLAALEAAGRLTTILEVWEPNAQHYRERGYRVVTGDVGHLASLGLPTFDLAFWFHGPEHLSLGDVPAALSALERQARLVIVGAPWGEYPLADTFGNPYNEHRCALQPSDFETLGYRVDTLGKRGQLAYSNILAVKP